MIRDLDSGEVKVAVHAVLKSLPVRFKDLQVATANDTQLQQMKGLVAWVSPTTYLICKCKIYGR